MELVLSLDISERHNLVDILQKAQPYCPMIKIGHFLLSQWEESYSEPLTNFPIFLDLKFLDIPNTVIKSLKNYKKRFPSITHYTIHGIAEKNLIQACCDQEDATPISVISLSSNESSQDTNIFLRQVERNMGLGIKNFVCPPNQIKTTKKQFGRDVILFVPGVRNQEAQSNDHFSTVTVSQAQKKEVDYIIVGRPIMDSHDIQESIKTYMP